MKWSRSITIALGCLGFLVPLRAAEWQTEVPPGPKDNFTKAAFSFWLADASPPPVALLVIVPGWNGDGRAAVNDKHWQAYARVQQLGLVGVYLQSDERKEPSAPYHVAERGSGEALLKAINQWAVAAKKPPLAQAGLLIWGHSAGGQFGYGMACHAPERVLAFAAIKGGFYFSQPTAATYQTPGLFIIGERDEAFRATTITKTFEAGRAQVAPWCLAFAPNSGHEVGKANELILPFFSGVLVIRAQQKAAPSQVINSSTGWLGIRSSLDIKNQVDNNVPAESLVRTVWLPDKSTAQVWQQFSGAAR